jgi:hypothetical protein
MARYITVDDIRGEGFDDTEPYEYSDADIEAAIDLWQQALERMCRQWFESRAITFKCDGTDSDTLTLGIPVISVSSLKINGCETDLETDRYEVYTNRTFPDDRRNPRIVLANDGNTSIFQGVQSTAKFRKGRNNQEVTGAFGFLEPDDSTPLLIKRALTKLVIEKLSNPMYGYYAGGSSNQSVGSKIEEWTDGHRLKYNGTTKPTGTQYMGITSDNEILDIVKMYKAPIGAATPANWSS